MKARTAIVNVPAFMDDPDWASFIPDLKSSAEKRGNPVHADCSPLDVDATARHLEPGGTLGRGLRGYEARPGQLDMLRAVTRAFNHRAILMIEAGTGVGKSLAYLVPAVQWASLNDTPVVVSTATRNLQGQLVGADIPRAVSTLPPDAAVRFRVALLKGRTNYLCLNALGDLMREGFYALSKEEQTEFTHLVEWLHETVTGDLDACDLPRLRAKVTSTGEDCAGRRCPYYSKCFVAKARAEALRAHLIVANHALVLADATSGGGGILPAYGRLVFDEAHNLEDIATDFFSVEISRAVFAQLLGKIERRAARGRRSRPRGVIGGVVRQLERGALAESPAAGSVHEEVAKIRIAAGFAAAAADELFATCERLFSPEPKAELVRFRCVPGGVPVPSGAQPPSVRQYRLHGLFADYTPAQWDEAAFQRALVVFEDRLAKVVDDLVRLSETLANACGPGELPLFGDLAGQVQGLAANFREFILNIKFVFAASDPSHVYWAERVKGSMRVVAAPLAVAEKMKALFYDEKDTVVLASATLRTGNSFAYAARKLGVDLAAAEAETDPDAEPRETPRVAMLTATSPFDYLRQSLLLAASFLPDPAAAGTAYAQALAPFLADLFMVTRGRGLVLFTSYEMMRGVADAARGAFELAGLRLLVQGDGQTRESMTAALKDATPEAPVVLFGAQSFWEGVDVPGAALSCVVLARLPFPQAGEPIVEARGERIEERGGSSFREYMLPETETRLRQGFGRLVRAKTDRGVVIVADCRLVAKNYGARFRKALPTSTHSIDTAAELLARVSEFLVC